MRKLNKMQYSCVTKYYWLQCTLFWGKRMSLLIFVGRVTDLVRWLKQNAAVVIVHAVNYVFDKERLVFVPEFLHIRNWRSMPEVLNLELSCWETLKLLGWYFILNWRWLSFAIDQSVRPIFSIFLLIASDCKSRYALKNSKKHERWI